MMEKNDIKVFCEPVLVTRTQVNENRFISLEKENSMSYSLFEDLSASNWLWNRIPDVNGSTPSVKLSLAFSSYHGPKKRKLTSDAEWSDNDPSFSINASGLIRTYSKLIPESKVKPRLSKKFKENETDNKDEEVIKTITTNDEEIDLDTTNAYCSEKTNIIIESQLNQGCLIQDDASFNGCKESPPPPDFKEDVIFSWQQSVVDVEDIITDSVPPGSVATKEDPSKIARKVSIIRDISPVDDSACQLNHDGYQCNVCGADISGFRYVCVQCVDFDLCGACEHARQHSAHYVLRVPGPRPASEVEATLRTIRRALGMEAIVLVPSDTPIDPDRIKEEKLEEEEDPIELGDAYISDDEDEDEDSLKDESSQDAQPTVPDLERLMYPNAFTPIYQRTTEVGSSYKSYSKGKVKTYEPLIKVRIPPKNEPTVREKGVSLSSLRVVDFSSLPARVKHKIAENKILRGTGSLYTAKRPVVMIPQLTSAQLEAAMGYDRPTS